MATVIDRLIVALELDPSKFNKGQKEAAEQFVKTRDQMKRGATNTEQEAGRVAGVIGGMRRTMLGFAIGLAHVFAVKELVEFGKKVTESDVKLGMFVRTTGVSAQRASVWQGVMTRLGGSAEDFNTSIGGLINEFETFDATGQSKVIPFFQSLGVQFTDGTGKMRDFEDVTFALFDRAQKMRPAQANWWLRQFGFTPEFINAGLKGSDVLRKLLDEQKKLNVVNQQDTDLAEKRTKAWGATYAAIESFSRVITNFLTPGIIGFASTLQASFQKMEETFKKSGLSGLMEQFLDDYKKFIEELSKDIPTKVFDFFDKTLGLGNFKLTIGGVEIIKPDAMIKGRDYVDPRSPKNLGDRASNAISFAQNMFDAEYVKRMLEAERKSKEAGIETSKIPGVNVKQGAGLKTPATEALAQQIQKEIPGVDRVTSLKDPFHPFGAHSRGQALDFTIRGGKQEAPAAADAVRKMLKDMGVDAHVRDEYNDPSSRASAPHIHVQFQSEAGVRKYLQSRGINPDAPPPPLAPGTPQPRVPGVLPPQPDAPKPLATDVPLPRAQPRAADIPDVRAGASVNLRPNVPDVRTGAAVTMPIRAGDADNRRTINSEVNIQNLNVNAPNATNADEVVGAMKPAIERASPIVPFSDAGPM